MTRIYYMQILLMLLLLHYIVNTDGRQGVLCFYTNSCGYRGSEGSVYDYAHFAESILGLKSILIFPKFLSTVNIISSLPGQR